ncbi:hypothetical protein FHS95_001036 [Sphingomonas naasensis]|uniref:Fe-S oxidoreductase n=1 Tax=Sphingomonas naasensis TaxID=1344951 RepID=A0A4S1W9K1_9SPHN|nr:hypothetical protein [Sphingomonas naasensis]NIJ19367.1 hypothetical protein [Sphingomonas naasensis]TGX39113.1 hypothetical protein E5A74_16445 [Sphingomonas naasensis]
MKLIILAAALAASGTAIAQEMPQQSTTTTTTTTETRGTTGAGMAAEDPKGGYMPSAPAPSGTPMPGQPVIFVPSPSPSEAYPAPAPLDHYPICKRGQFDNCRQRGG